MSRALACLAADQRIHDFRALGCGRLFLTPCEPRNPGRVIAGGISERTAWRRVGVWPNVIPPARMAEPYRVAGIDLESSTFDLPNARDQWRKPTAPGEPSL